MNPGKAAYLVIFVLILAAIFVVEVRLPPGFPFGAKSTTATGPHESCSTGWNVTGYYTPVETDFSGSTQTVTVNGTSRTFYSSFLSEVQTEGWGQTKSGDYVGYDGGVFTSSKSPLNSLDEPLRLGDVAVDFAVIPAGSNLTIPSIPAPWNTTKFVADDSGSGIVGKHVDVYAGLGSGAKQADDSLTSANQTVCAFVEAVGGPTSYSLQVVSTQTQLCRIIR